MFSWLRLELAEFEHEPTETFSDCLDKELGRFVNYFGFELIDTLLDLPDAELTEIYPESKCPMSYNERQALKKRLDNHVLSCAACTHAVLLNQAEILAVEQKLRKSAQTAKQTFNHLAVNP
jgi:hypothetical protein